MITRILYDYAHSAMITRARTRHQDDRLRTPSRKILENEWKKMQHRSCNRRPGNISTIISSQDCPVLASARRARASDNLSLIHI